MIFAYVPFHAGRGEDFTILLKQTQSKNLYKRSVPDIRSVIVNHDRYHTTNRPTARANEKGPLTGGYLISSMVTVNIYVQHLYRELNLC